MSATSARPGSGSRGLNTASTLQFLIERRYVFKSISPLQNRQQCGRNICSSTYPSQSRAAFAYWHGQTNLIRVEHIAEVDAGTGSETVISPSPSIYVKELVLRIPRIELILQFGQTIVVDCA